MTGCALFALMLTVGLVFLFWVEASHRIGWADAALAFVASVLFVLAIILARRREKAAWILRPTWRAKLLAVLGALLLMYGALYADRYLLHRMDITASRFRHDMTFGIPVSVAVLLSLQRQNTATRQLP